MMQALIMNLYLYFPEDKTEYIPAFIWMFVFFIGAFLTWRFVIKVSKKEEEKIKELERKHSAE
ncbi:hypothetical protein [Priestia flexa]|jgi:hypothetical protein|uniref:Uncharacterized protein n=3 Tax=Priestia flexa TaxID=86664 RepID=A0A8I1MHT8_9BACI|nr:hypothetical protein [Priestia flexa]MBN8253121.1 hypothetical protein [Priestia flexa]MBN8433760.1 hypothetical protein [Priestia flexa]MCA0965982.1 hypothetical protein [Priestia flexa]UZW67172.1 hypothetical protein OC195_05490 [Priestia flexa]